MSSASNNSHLPPWLELANRELAALQVGSDSAASVLVCGVVGLGQEFLLNSIAQSRLCQVASVGEFCGNCASCNQFKAGTNPDVFAIKKPEDKSGILIEQIREAVQWVQLTSHQNHGRVLLIHGAHLMNEAAANSLLKTLEEPPPKALIILETNQPGRLLPTIRSRCLIQRLSIPEQAIAVNWLLSEIGDEIGGEAAIAENYLMQCEGAPYQARQLAQSSRQDSDRATAVISSFIAGKLNPVAAAEALAAIDPFVPEIEQAVAQIILQIEKNLLLADSDECAEQKSPDLLIALQRYQPESLLNWLRELIAVRRLAETPLNRLQLCETLFLAAPKAARH